MPNSGEPELRELTITAATVEPDLIML